MEEIDLKELIGIFLERKTTIILLVAIFMVLGFIYSAFLVVPKYSSYTTLLLAQTSTSSDSTITTTDITLNSKLVSTYSNLMQSTTVIRQVISNLGIDDSEGDIKNSVSVTAESDTEIIRITVTNTNPEKAAKIANEMASVFIDESKRLFNIDNINVVDPAEANYTPSNINHVRTIVLFGAVGLVIGVAYTFIVYMLDNSIKSQEDIEKSMHIPVLASIPVYQVEGTNSKSNAKSKNRKKTTKGGKRR